MSSQVCLCVCKTKSKTVNYTIIPSSLGEVKITGKITSFLHNLGQLYYYPQGIRRSQNNWWDHTLSHNLLSLVNVISSMSVCVCKTKSKTVNYTIIPRALGEARITGKITSLLHDLIDFMTEMGPNCPPGWPEWGKKWRKFWKMWQKSRKCSFIFPNWS